MRRRLPAPGFAQAVLLLSAATALVTWQGEPDPPPAAKAVPMPRARKAQGIFSITHIDGFATGGFTTGGSSRRPSLGRAA